MIEGLGNRKKEFRFDMVGTKESLKVLQMGRDAPKMWLREGVSGDSVKKTEMERMWK